MFDSKGLELSLLEMLPLFLLLDLTVDLSATRFCIVTIYPLRVLR